MDFPDSRQTAVFMALGQVPPGHVISYGKLAQLAGLGQAARWVGRLLGRLPEDSQLPWHRVIAASGRISLPAGSPSGDEQRQRLQAEGITICNNRVNMRRYGWPSGEYS